MMRRSTRARARRTRPRPARIAILTDPGVAASWQRSVPALALRVRRAAAAALDAAATSAPAAELTIRLSGDSVVQRLNRDFRRKDKPTNVLSFPAAEGPPLPPGAPLLLGDVVIAYGTVVREAAAQGKSVADHLVHLVVHGVLHLLGYDHEKPGEAKRMESLETRILAGLGIADPYAPQRRRA